MKLTDPVAEILPREFTPAEIEWAESQHGILDPDRAGDLMAVLSSPGYIQTLEFAAASALEQQCIIAAGWHRMRGRLELADQFEGLAVAVKALIKAREN